MLDEAYDKFYAEFPHFFCFFDFAIVDDEAAEVGLDLLREFSHHFAVHILEGEVFA